MAREEFERRYREQFYDPAFSQEPAPIDRLMALAWEGYQQSRKAPRTRKAGDGFADPDYDLSIEWLEARQQVLQAAERHHNAQSRPRVLLICAASRNDKTCPGEISKTYRLVSIGREALEAGGTEVDLLDLSVLTSEYRRVIFPCKACVSTAMPLCHWPCSCYPNHALGQVNDWMNEIYPRWVAAHGIMIITPVYWYQAPSGLKLMMDRLVCADGGNPDPTTTRGKDPERAKRLELEGWPYPRHLAGRAFAIVVHGDTVGAETLRRSLVDWLTDMKLVQAGAPAAIDRYVGYYEPYATSHDALDRDHALQREVRNATRSLMAEVERLRKQPRQPELELREPRPK
jgi:multimeric flavodoxin WrbA